MPCRIFERYNWWYVQEPLGFKRLTAHSDQNVLGRISASLSEVISSASEDSYAIIWKKCLCSVQKTCHTVLEFLCSSFSYLVLLKLFSAWIFRTSHPSVLAHLIKGILCLYNRYEVFLDPWLTWRQSPTYPPRGEQRVFSPSTHSILKAFCRKENEDYCVIIFSLNIPFWLESEMKNKKCNSSFLY